MADNDDTLLDVLGITLDEGSPFPPVTSSTSPDYGKKYKTLRDALLALLWDGVWHTHKECVRVANPRFSARLLELKRIGYQIESRESPSGHGKNYRLISRKIGVPQGKNVKVFLTESDAEEITENGILTTAAQEAVKEALLSFQANKDKL